MCFKVMGFFGSSISSAVAAEIVAIVSVVGWAAIVASLLMTVISAGGLSLVSMSIDAFVITLREIIRTRGTAQAICW